LEPLVFVRRVVEHEIGEHADPALVGSVRELAEVVEGAERSSTPR